jgi:PII-like signaling protein
MIYSSEQAEVDGVRQHEPLLQSLRASNARGAHARDLGLPRQLRSAWRPGCCNCVATSPSWTVLVDRPGAIVRSFAIVDELTRERSLVTSEIVPALSALTEQGRRDGLRLARPRR